MFTQNGSSIPRIAKGITTVILACVLGGCMVYNNDSSEGGIGFRESRFAEISAMREFRQCRDEAIALDTKARQEGSVSKYLASARLLEKCESEVGVSTARVGKDERMKAYALSIQNFFKGGDIAAATRNLKKMKTAFPGKDIYLADGSSFIETLEVLLGVKDQKTIGEYSIENINKNLKAELRRFRYWKRN